MLPTFGSRLFELVDKTIDEKYRLMFIASTYEAFFDEDKKELWDKELEPQQIIFDVVNDNEVQASITLANGSQIVL